MKILFLGDIVCREARKTVLSELPKLKNKYEADIIIINIENAAGGRGVTPKIAEQFFDAGVDILTTGNHVWDQRELIKYIADSNSLLRPINMPEGTPGLGKTSLELDDGRIILIINAMCNLFMPKNDFVFRSIEESLLNLELGNDYNAIFIDLHGEATSEKIAIANYFDGKVSAIVGTHTHVPTSDARILPNGTAFQTDVGMCGNYDSVIGMEKSLAIDRFFSKKSHLTVAEGEITICGVCVETDDYSGKSLSIEPIRIGGVLTPTWKNIVKIGDIYGWPF